MTLVGMLGGTGPLGRGLALRLAAAGHDVILGSRSAERAADAAAQLQVPARGMANAQMVDQAEVVFVTVPYDGQADVLGALADAAAGKVVVSTVVPMGFDQRGPFRIAVPEGSAAEQCQQLLPGARVVSGLQSVPAPKLLKPDLVIDMDVPLLTDDAEAGDAVARLCGDIPGLRSFVAGPLRLSSCVEALTPLIVSVNKRYKAHAGVKFTGIRL